MDQSETLANLLRKAQDLLRDVQDGSSDDETERTRRRAHRLRETLGVALIVSERFAQQHENGSMIELDSHGDGTGTASFTVDLSSAELEAFDN